MGNLNFSCASSKRTGKRRPAGRFEENIYVGREEGVS